MIEPRGRSTTWAHDDPVCGAQPGRCAVSPSLDPWHHGLPIHGGSAPQVLRKARYRQAELVALEIIRNYGGRPPVTDPITALSELAPRPWRSRTTCAARWTLCGPRSGGTKAVSYTHLRAHETVLD